jgi:beta-N-acetylhexosaminidase
MPAHIVFSSLDKNKPATVSRPILQNLLRGELGFQGLVISDSMSMAAISKNRNWEQTVVEAVRAGVDVLLLTNSPAQQRRAFRALVKAARRDPQTAARVTQSCRRILQTKARFQIWKP